jgi:hypothetical protein
VQVKLTVTVVLFQFSAFGGGETEAVIDGGVSSMLSGRVAVAVFPA